MHHKTFHAKADKLYNKLDDLEIIISGEAVQQVRASHAQQTNITLTDDDVLDISTSYHGSWLTRGHTSNIGVGSMVDLLTGLHRCTVYGLCLHSLIWSCCSKVKFAKCRHVRLAITTAI